MTALMKLSGGASMSSREIAELVDSRHDSVRRTVERLAERGVIALPPMVEKPSTGCRPAAEYVFSGESQVRHADFAARYRDELDAEYYENFVVRNSRVPATEAIGMTADQCRLAAMRRPGQVVTPRSSAALESARGVQA